MAGIMSACTVNPPAQQTLQCPPPVVFNQNPIIEVNIPDDFCPVAETKTIEVPKEVIRKEVIKEKIPCVLPTIEKMALMNPMKYDDVKHDQNLLLTRSLGWVSDMQILIKQLEKEYTSCQQP